jgi:hypothetical protein
MGEPYITLHWRSSRKQRATSARQSSIACRPTSSASTPPCRRVIDRNLLPTRVLLKLSAMGVSISRLRMTTRHSNHEMSAAPSAPAPVGSPSTSERYLTGGPLSYSAELAVQVIELLEGRKNDAQDRRHRRHALLGYGP